VFPDDAIGEGSRSADGASPLRRNRLRQTKTYDRIPGPPGQELRFYRSVAIMHRGGRADLLIGPSERAPALRVGQEADPDKSGYGLKNGAPDRPDRAVDKAGGPPV